MRRLRFIMLPLVVSLAALGASCAAPEDETAIREFFTAARERDPAFRSLATVPFDPDTQGSVTEFTVVSGGDERRAPLNHKSLQQAIADARKADEDFTKAKVDFQNENMEAIQRVLKAEAGGGKLSAADLKMQEQWTKYRDDTAAFAKKVSDARIQFEEMESLIELSASTIRNPVKAIEHDGEMVTKEVTVSAPVATGGSTVEKTLVITLQRAVLAGDPQIVGRWIVTGVRES